VYTCTSAQVSTTAERDKLQFELQQTAQRLVSTESSLKSTQAAFEAADAHLSEATLKLHAATAEVAALKRRLDAAEAERAVLADELKATAAARAAAEKAVGELQPALASMTHSSRTAEEQLATCSVQVGVGVGVGVKDAIRPGKLYPDDEPWAVKAIRITALSG
jgi:chromosome segregation ATPase